MPPISQERPVPVYDYGCPMCMTTVELLVPMSKADEQVCSVCGNPLIRKVSLNTSFQLKGGGWYKDGYGSTPNTRGKA